MVPWDLWIAVLVIATVAIFAFRIGLLAKRAHTNPLVPLAAALLVSVLLCLVFRANLRWAGAIPLAAVVIWSNLVPVVLAFTAGVTWNTSVLGSKFRSATSGFLVLLSLAYLVMPVARPCLAPPELQPPVWGDDVVCLQSHDSTCAPAAAVTLLNLNGIRSSEKEMVRLCLTSQQGTEALGLFRGLKLGSQKNGHKVQIASRNPVDWISSGQLPNVALVCFPEDEFGPIRGTTAPRQFLGRRREAGHAVVVVGYEGGKWTIADPAVGSVKWSHQELLTRFTGDSLYLSEH